MSTLYTLDARDAVPHAVLTLDASQKYTNRNVINLYVNEATSKWLALAFYWTAYQFTVVSIY